MYVGQNKNKDLFSDYYDGAPKSDQVNENNIELRTLSEQKKYAQQVQSAAQIYNNISTKSDGSQKRVNFFQRVQMQTNTQDQ